MQSEGSRKINILYLIDHYHAVGGTETHLARLVNSLNKDKFNCTIIAFDFANNWLADSIRANGTEFLHIPVGRYYTYNAFKQSRIISSIIEKKKIDIVQTYHIKSDFYGGLIACISGVKYIISSKRDIGDLKSSWHFFLNKLVRGITCKYITPADAVGEVVIRKEGVSPDKVVTIYNGVDTECFRPVSYEERLVARSNFGFSPDEFIIGTVAWLRPEKNYTIFFNALKKVSQKINNFKAVAVGGDEDGGHHTDFLKKYVNDLGIAQNVLFTGQIDDVIPYLKAFDVACLVPGGNEGFSNSIIEKMAMGLPLVVSDVGGNAEAVVDGYNGFVIPPNNSEKLTEALIYLAEHPDERKEMGRRSVERVREMFTLDGMIKAHEELYESIMAG